MHGGLAKKHTHQRAARGRMTMRHTVQLVQAFPSPIVARHRGRCRHVAGALLLWPAQGTHRLRLHGLERGRDGVKSGPHPRRCHRCLQGHVRPERLVPAACVGRHAHARVFVVLVAALQEGIAAQRAGLQRLQAHEGGCKKMLASSSKLPGYVLQPAA